RSSSARGAALAAPERRLMVLAARRLIFLRSDWDATGGVKDGATLRRVMASGLAVTGCNRLQPVIAAETVQARFSTLHMIASLALRILSEGPPSGQFVAIQSSMCPRSCSRDRIPPSNASLRTSIAKENQSNFSGAPPLFFGLRSLRR